MASKTERPRVLIVGGLGYFGSRLAQDLSSDFDVVVTSRSLAGARKHWLESGKKNIRWLRFDSSLDAVLAKEESFKCVINLASPSSQEISADFDCAHSLALKTLDACTELLRSHRAEKLIHFSSFHVYGATPRPVFWEEINREPTHPYGEVHLRGEKYLEQNAAELPIAILRPTNGVGSPCHSDLGVQSKLLFLDCCRQAIEKQKIELLSDGFAFRDFIPLSDFITAVRKLLLRKAPKLQFFNLASGQVTTLKALAMAIQKRSQKFLNQPVELVFGVKPDPFRTPFEIDTEKLRETGWSPNPSLDTEMDQTLAFFEENNRRVNRNFSNAATASAIPTIPIPT